MVTMKQSEDTGGTWELFIWFTLWLFNIAMENDPFIDGLLVYLLNMVIFHGYVK